MSIADKLRRDSQDIWRNINTHPFVAELYSGTLAKETFCFYVLQDYHYLVAAMRNFALIAAKAPSVPEMRALIDILNLEATSEFAGYENLLQRLGYTLRDAEQVESLPVTVSYSSFLLATSSLKSYAEAITAVLPCFWSYAEIAAAYKGALAGNDNSLYVEWGQVYLTEDYLRLVDKLKHLVNRAAEGVAYRKLHLVFQTASQYEYWFWDAVYHKRGWP